ncbi:hypothetical protein [Dialister sp.]|uniref:hypothetical protein n=1 Tax=Dialister sp. TaxID=1955814 RepID=UPI003EFD2056
MKYGKTAALACAFLLCAGAVQAADKKQESVLPQRFSDAMTWNLQNRPEDITITKVAVPADKGQTAGQAMPAAPAGNGQMNPPPGGFNPPDHVTQGTAARNITENSTLEDQVFGSTGDDENALRVTGAAVSLKNVEIDKQEGKSSSTEGGDFYGMNAAFLATDGAQVTVEDSAVHSAAPNGNGLFSYGKGTKISAKNVTITTESHNSGGLQTTGGGTMEAENVTVSTAGNSSASIRSDRGGGTVRVKGGSFRTAGYGSPAIYSTADIAVEGAALYASRSEGAVIEGKNSIALKDCSLEGNMSDTRVMGSQTIKEENVHTIMIYQSMSGDAEEGTSSFSMEGGSLVSHKGDIFYVTNTDCTIHLDNVKIKNEDASGVFLRVSGNSASRGWGQAGANGGKAVFTAENQKIEGNILVDSISHLTMTLGRNSDWKGALLQTENEKGSSKEAGADLTIEKGAVWTLTADSTVTTLHNEGKIVTNGHTLTVLNK